MKKKFFLATFVAAPLLALLLSAATVWLLFQTRYEGPDVAFRVYPGDTFGEVNSRLRQGKVISNPRLFHWLARYRGQMEKLRAGAFPIKSGSTMPEVLDALVHGTPLLTGITIPEGRNLWEIAGLMERARLASKDEFIAAASDPELARELGVEAQTLEGYLFPETYRFAPGTAVKDIIATMVRQFRQRVATTANGHPTLTAHQVVILASVVEKETGAKAERPMIASVFLNRLKKRMRLESDPTTIYGMGQNYAGNLRRDDLQTLTPYNTYKIPALPIGPIANPSLEAIEAVMRPAVSENLFFVSKNDGTHAFTRTYAEHQRAVDEWQRNRANRAGKSWRQLKQ
jgi:UPF0755 protein